jgi:hypothetical protein
MKKLTMILSALLLFAGTLFPQVSADLTIENQNVVGTDFFFDLYLRTSQASDSLFLGNSDYVLTFDNGNFNSPVLTLEGDIFGEAFCTFVPRVVAQASGTRTLYTGVIATQLSGNQIIINTNGPSASSHNFFNNRIARIDNTTSTHRLGRFKISGISNPSGFMNLQWVTGNTLVASIDPVTLNESQIAVNPINPGNTPLPVELTSFTSKYLNDKVQLNWQTKTEVNNYGFNVERRINEGEWDKIGFVEGHGNSNSPKEYSYTDKELFAGGSKFQYRLKQIDTDGQFEYSDVVEVEVVPDQFELSQNYPNPFNPSTTIRFSLPQAAQIKINLYNMLGEQVASIAEGMYESGYHKVTFNASNLPSGTYIYRLESSDFVQVKKMMLIK